MPDDDHEITFEGFSLPVSDLDTSIRFYEQLGFHTEILNPQHSFALMRLGSGTLGLLKVAASVLEDSAVRKVAALVQVELSVADLDALYQRLVDSGVRIDVPPRDRGFERSMQCRDPDGFTVEFAEGRRGQNRTRPGA
ncbi:MAG: VOC family protein [Chloroflexi bacterium]|nr:VOC family protein [Chloroflexota bacterium]